MDKMKKNANKEFNGNSQSGPCRLFEKVKGCLDEYVMSQEEYFEGD